MEMRQPPENQVVPVPIGQPLLLGAFIFTGTVLSILTFMDRYYVGTGTPMIRCIVMVVGELTCGLLVHIYLVLRRAIRGGRAGRKVMEMWEWRAALKVFPAALCDITVLFTSTRPVPYEWLGIMFTIIGSVTVSMGLKCRNGHCNLFPEDYDENDYQVDFFLLASGFVLLAARNVLEDRLLHQQYAHPLNVVVWKGIWGLVLGMIVILATQNNEWTSKSLEDITNLLDSSHIIEIVTGAVLSFFFHVCSLLVIAKAGATSREVVDFIRLPVVYVLLFPLSEINEKIFTISFDIITCVGIVIVLLGIILYLGILHSLAGKQWIVDDRDAGSDYVSMHDDIPTAQPRYIPPRRSSTHNHQFTSSTPPARLARTESLSLTPEAQQVMAFHKRPMSTKPMPPPLSTEFEIDFKEIEVGDVIGRGASGMVYEGKWHGSTIAIKILYPTLLTQDFVGDFRRETQIMSRLHHPNVIRFIGACTTLPTLAICTEFMSLGSLYEHIHGPYPPISLSMIVQMAVDIAAGILYLHSFTPPIIHRDIKPRNILVGEGYKVKITDFGNAWVEEDVTKTYTCTPLYAAPEVLRHQTHSVKSDSFSFGILLCEMYTKQEPYTGENGLLVGSKVVDEGLRPNLPPSTPEPLARLIEWCWLDNLEDRPDFQQILDALLEMLGDPDLGHWE